MNAQADIICTLEKVEKSYKKGPAALGPLSLCVHEGEAVGIKGSNGAGKSTLLKLIAGVIKPDKGTVFIAKSARGKTAYVPQDIALYENLTGLDNLRFWGHVYGMPKKQIEIRCRWLLEQMSLTEKAQDTVSSYSGGMKRRLQLATALVQTPSLLLLDEPTVGADASSAEMILAFTEKLRDNGCGVVFVSHRKGEVERLCKNIIYLDGGYKADADEVST